MRLLQFKQNDEQRLGVKTAHGILDVKQAALQFNETPPNSIQDLILGSERDLEALQRVVNQALDTDCQFLFLDENKIEYQQIVTCPEKIICVGLNYMSHIEESKMDIPISPVLFSKFNNALASHNQKIALPQVASKYDYEAELVIIMGKTAKNVSENDALSYVFGYSVGNDLSARDLQLKTGQWLIGKTLDNFAPIGPYLVTADEVNPFNLKIECKVNGETRQSSNTKHMIFNYATLISYISQHMTLKPGDIIFSGTPEGVILGYAEEKQQWLKSGDEIEICIENVGTLRNMLV